MNKKIIVIIIAILVCSTGFLSVGAVEINLTKKIKFYNLNEPLITKPGDIKKDLLNSDISFENTREVYIPNIKPTYFDDSIVSLIEELNEEIILGFLENLTSFGPRVTATEACDKSGEYIYNEFEDMGLDTRYHYWNSNGLYGNNIEATINGYDSNSDEIYIICAHYDSVSGSPGADDDGSGVAAVMAAAKLMSNHNFKNTVKFIAFSGEEQGLHGSKHYVEDAINNNTSIAGVLNVDMIGYSETEEDTKYLKVYQDTHNPLEWLTDYTINVSEEYYNFINLEIVPSGWSWGSDHYYFWQAGYSAIFYAENNFNKYYHSSKDTIENMNISYTVKNSKLIIATLAELAEISDLQAPNKPIIIKSQLNGKFGEEYNYSALTTDLQNDDIYYFWDWGDNTDSGWIGPSPSGIEYETSNIWSEKGEYTIKVKAKDTDGYESEWSDPIYISMPKYTQTISILQKLIIFLKKFDGKISNYITLI